MQFYTKKRRQPAPVILPLIDILAILLIFFIITTTFKKTAPQLQINLPESTTAQEAASAENEPLLLQISAEEEIVLDGTPLTLENLPQALQTHRETTPERPLALQADRAAPFGLVVRVLDALREAGIEQLPAFTQPLAPSPASK